MLDEGYAAVSMRSVAKAAGLSSALVHYYYPTTDDLFVALYQHSSAEDLKRLQSALASEDPVAALWAYQTDSARTVLGIEFLALANHRKAIRKEISRFVEFARNLQAKALQGLAGDMSSGAVACSPLCMATLMTSIARNLIVEDGVGISLGHAEARAFVEQSLEQLRQSQ